jgi:hypothetical protein
MDASAKTTWKKSGLHTSTAEQQVACLTGAMHLQADATTQQQTC